MQKTFSFALKGGLDLVTPAAIIDPGKVIGAKNYEPDDEGGYRRLFGYERFDGLPSPSDAFYTLLNFDAGTGAAIVATDIVTGDTSGATSEVLSVTLTSGSWTVDAVGFPAGLCKIGDNMGKLVCLAFPLVVHDRRSAQDYHGRGNYQHQPKADDQHRHGFETQS